MRATRRSRRARLLTRDGSRLDDDIDAAVVLCLLGQPEMPVVLELRDRYGGTLASQVELEGRSSRGPDTLSPLVEPGVLALVA